MSFAFFVDDQQLKEGIMHMLFADGPYFIILFFLLDNNS